MWLTLVETHCFGPPGQVSLASVAPYAFVPSPKSQPVTVRSASSSNVVMEPEKLAAFPRKALAGEVGWVIVMVGGSPGTTTTCDDVAFKPRDVVTVSSTT